MATACASPAVFPEAQATSRFHCSTSQLPLERWSGSRSSQLIAAPVCIRNGWRLQAAGTIKGREHVWPLLTAGSPQEAAAAEDDHDNRPCSCPRERSGWSEAAVCSGSRRAALVAAAVTALTAWSTPAGGVWMEPSARALEGGGSSSAVEDAVRQAVRMAVSPPKAAAVLRLAFHDAGTFDCSRGTGGMNGSVLYELERPESSGLKRAVKALERARLELDPSLAVSWADLIAVAGAESVAICGGPHIPVRLGRLDSGAPDEEGQMPEETLSAPALKESFRAKGFSPQEMVALSGAHTLGSKGFGDPVGFDNSYYTILLQKPWAAAGGNSMSAMIGLPTDRAIVSDSECLHWIETYASSQPRFFQDFSAAYTKLVESGARWEARSPAEA